MKISIIIATYNAGKTLERCLKSIIPQKTEETEILVIDGGSKDNTLSIIEECKNYISYTISEPDNGVYDAWNKGIDAAKGDWIMFIGADDILMPDALKTYLAFLNEKSNEDIDFISSKIQIRSEGDDLTVAGKKWVYDRCRINMDVIHVASLTRREYLIKMGGFDTKYKIVGDYDFLMRGGKKMNATFCNHIVAVMALGGISFSVKGLREQFVIKHRAGNVPYLYCVLIFLMQLFLFYTYKLRH